MLAGLIAGLIIVAIFSASNKKKLRKTSFGFAVPSVSLTLSKRREAKSDSRNREAKSRN